MFLGVTDQGQYSGVMFGETRLGSQRHHVAARGLTGVLPSVADYSEVRIVTGVCLFGAAGIQFSGRDKAAECPTVAGLGSAKVDTIHVHDNLTLYELETTRRIPAELRRQLSTLPPTVPTSTIVDMPRIQYYGYPIDAYRMDRISRQLLLRYWQHVDRRCRLASAALRDRIGLAVRRAGRPDTRIADSPGLGPAESALRNAIVDGWPAGYGPQPEQRLVSVMITALLASPAGAEWRWLLAFARPTTLAELAITSYIWQLVRPSLLDTQTGRPVLTIMLDDIGEQRLYGAARDVLAAITADRPGVAQNTLVAIFPLAKLFHAGQPATRRLYHSVRANTFRAEDGRLLTNQQLAAEVTSWP